jgi:hypothetical protein
MQNKHPQIVVEYVVQKDTTTKLLAKWPGFTAMHTAAEDMDMTHKTHVKMQDTHTEEDVVTVCTLINPLVKVTVPLATLKPTHTAAMEADIAAIPHTQINILVQVQHLKPQDHAACGASMMNNLA